MSTTMSQGFPVSPSDDLNSNDPTAERRHADVGPPPRTPERRIRHRTPSGLVATDGLKMSCPCCGASESAVVRRLAGEIRCFHCGHVESDVVKVKGLIDTDAIRRRRECAGCGARFPTHETVDQDRLQQELTEKSVRGRGPASSS